MAANRENYSRQFITLVLRLFLFSVNGFQIYVHNFCRCFLVLVIFFTEIIDRNHDDNHQHEHEKVNWNLGLLEHTHLVAYQAKSILLTEPMEKELNTMKEAE